MALLPGLRQQLASSQRGIDMLAAQARGAPGMEQSFDLQQQALLGQALAGPQFAAAPGPAGMNPAMARALQMRQGTAQAGQTLQALGQGLTGVSQGRLQQRDESRRALAALQLRQRAAQLERAIEQMDLKRSEVAAQMARQGSMIAGGIGALGALGAGAAAGAFEGDAPRTLAGEASTSLQTALPPPTIQPRMDTPELPVPRTQPLLGPGDFSPTSQGLA